MNVVVVGTGYVGLVTGLGFSKLGHRVACVDTDAAKIGRLDMGEAPFFEPGLSDLLKEAQEKGSIMFTTQLSSVMADAEIIVIAVGTPPTSTGEADLTYVFSVADQVGKLLDHEAIVVVKSTVPVGTNRQVLARVRAAMTTAGHGDAATLVQNASVPEFLREGSALSDFFGPDRLVIGADDEPTRAILDLMHEGITAPRVFLSVESAELTKYAANAFLATKISFINEISNVADRVGADVRDIAKAIGLDRRIGPAFLNAGVGYGGSCFPKDVTALHQMAGHNGYDFKLLSAVIEVNNRQRDLFVRRVEEALGGVQGRLISVWGLAFKGGTDDVRESAAIDIVQRLYARGAEVQVFDPQAMETAKKYLGERVQYAATPIDAATGAEALLVLADWPEFRAVSFDALKSAMLEPRIFDGRNFLADFNLGAHGFAYYGVGIPRSVHPRNES